MKEIIKLFVRYHFTIFFVVLEIVAFSLVVLHNNYQRTVFSDLAAALSDAFSFTVSTTKDYFLLKETNEEMVAENTKLRNQIEAYKTLCQNARIYPAEHSVSGNFTYIPARMINLSFNKTKNYITINQGEEDGISTEMAVCSKEGVVGIIEKTSNHYAKILPLINVNLRVSAKVAKNGYYGSLQWDGNDYRYTYLNDIPFHVDVEIGDTIVTSGFSTIFPEDELIGFVESINKQTANFLSIKVRLATDFKKISNVYVIANTRKQEQQELESDYD